MARRPPEPLVYYLDANLDGPELVEALRASGMRTEAHRDHCKAVSAHGDLSDTEGQLLVHFGGERRGGHRNG